MFLSGLAWIMILLLTASGIVGMTGRCHHAQLISNHDPPDLCLSRIAGITK
jgi:hypothetical protein